MVRNPTLRLLPDGQSAPDMFETVDDVNKSDAAADAARIKGIPVVQALRTEVGWFEEREQLLTMARVGLWVLTVLIIGLQVDDRTRGVCEQLAGCSPGGMYIHAADAGKALDEAFAKVASQFVMPKVKSADAAAAGGGTRGV